MSTVQMKSSQKNSRINGFLTPCRQKTNTSICPPRPPRPTRPSRPYQPSQPTRSSRHTLKHVQTSKVCPPRPSRPSRPLDQYPVREELKKVQYRMPKKIIYGEDQVRHF